MPLVMAHKLQRFLCDGDLGSVSSRYDKKTNIETVEVEILTRDKRSFHLVLELSPSEYKDLINNQVEIADKSDEELPLGRKSKTNAAAPKAAAEVAPLKTPPSVEFTPPTEILKTERQKLSKKDPREGKLLDAFIKAYKDPYKGRKKLNHLEQQAKEKRLKDIEIARSLILSGDRTTVERWIKLLNEWS